jgi:hypothetical protein
MKNWRRKMPETTPSGEWPVDLRQMDPEDYIPWEWQHVFCICNTEWNTSRFEKDGSPSKCPTCHKAQRWLLIKSCRSCKQPYYHYFSHPNRSDYKGKPTCRDCIVKQTGIEAGSVPDWFKPRVLRSLDEILADDDFEIEEFSL